MAKTNRPIAVLVHPDLRGTDAIVDLWEKQNEVVEMDALYTDSEDASIVDTTRFDLIIGPNCWRIVPGMENLIKEAVKAARKAKYSAKKVVS